MLSQPTSHFYNDDDDGQDTDYGGIGGGGADGVMTDVGTKRVALTPPPPTDAAAPPPAKRARPSFLAHLHAAVGAAPTPSEMSKGSGGTHCHAIVVRKPEGHSYATKDGGMFQSVNVPVILGMPDPATYAKIDEATDEVLFDMPEPRAMAEALRIRKATKSNDFIEVSERVQHRQPLYQTVRLTVPLVMSLPGVMCPSVVDVKGLSCRSHYDGNGKLWIDLNARDVTPIACIGANPTQIVRYIRESGALSTWHYEEPHRPDGTPKGVDVSGSHPLIVTIGRMDDVDTLLSHTPLGPRRDFVAMVRVGPGSAADYFYLSKIDRAEHAARKKQNKDYVVPAESNAGLDNWQPFGIRATWKLTVVQWDGDRDPLMCESNPLSYEMTVSAYGDNLWSAGLSHPRHWAIFRFHIPFVDGILMCQENRKDTSKLDGNSGRRQIVESLPPGTTDPRRGGMGLKQIVATFCRGVVLDMPSYLRGHALRCSFRTATMLMGAQEGDAEDLRRFIKLTGVYGEEKFTKNNEINTLKLNFSPEGFVCLNSTTKYVNMRLLDQEVDQYYVLTAMAPRYQRDPGSDSDQDLTAMLNFNRAAMQIPAIGDAEVLRICREACLGVAEKQALEAEWSNPAATASQRAAATWLAAHDLGDISHAPIDTEPPWLVFATYRPPEPEIVRRNEEAFEIATKAWRHGPAGIIAQGRADIRINAPPQDEIDLAMLPPPPPPLEDAPQGSTSSTHNLG